MFAEFAEPEEEGDVDTCDMESFGECVHACLHTARDSMTSRVAPEGIVQLERILLVGEADARSARGGGRGPAANSSRSNPGSKAAADGRSRTPGRGPDRAVSKNSAPRAQEQYDHEEQLVQTHSFSTSSSYNQQEEHAQGGDEFGDDDAQWQSSKHERYESSTSHFDGGVPERPETRAYSHADLDRVDAEFDRVDTNNDGELSRAEYEAAYGQDVRGRSVEQRDEGWHQEPASSQSAGHSADRSASQDYLDEPHEQQMGYQSKKGEAGVSTEEINKRKDAAKEALDLADKLRAAGE